MLNPIKLDNISKVEMMVYQMMRWKWLKFNTLLVRNDLISKETALKHIFQFDEVALKEELMKIVADVNA